tara:strand:+ start:122 stop:313 length:192 start_codon:yes stop_codon:yes gene_type:complete
MTKRNPPILPPADPLGSDEWHDIQQSVGALDTQVKADEKKSKESGSNSYASENKKIIKALKKD